MFLVGAGLRIVSDAVRPPRRAPATTGEAVRDLLRGEADRPRTTATYGGLGVWVDAFDFDPAYQAEGGAPAVEPEVVTELAELGVRTIYVQAARIDERSDGRLLDEDLLGELLLRAHAEGIDVVGWYLPRFADVDADLDRLLAIAGFEVLGHRFDGVAVDIEHVEAVPDPVERSARLIDLSQRLRAARPGEVLGAIVPPPVQLEVVNPTYWRDFPWRALDTSYDVWLPMAYWTTRSGDYRDPYRYAEESVRRLRNNLGRQDIVVHVVGGIGDETTDDDLRRFRRALEVTGAIGGSIYDWASLPEDLRRELPGTVP